MRSLVTYLKFSSYVQYSNIAAKIVRKSLKPQLQTEAEKRGVVSIKFTKWEGGKPTGESTFVSRRCWPVRTSLALLTYSGTSQ